MDFRTRLTIHPHRKNISHKDTLFLMGSCFSHSIGQKLTEAGFTCQVNPFGTIYNPLAMAKQINRIVNQIPIKESEIISSQGLYVHPDFHSSLSGVSREEAYLEINQKIASLHHPLKESEWLFLTLGTAMGYIWHETGQIVGNCHKMPAKQFSKKLFSIEDITRSLHQELLLLQELNPKLQVVLTVSPVRHIREGMPENQRSKARLIEAAHQLTEQLSFAFYLPVYEWFIDDLRDYRFYSEDMVHPSETAIAYIWEQFQHCFMDTKTRQLADEVSRLHQASQHRPMHGISPEFIEFCRTRVQKIDELRQSCAHLQLGGVEAYFKAFLKE